MDKACIYQFRCSSWLLDSVVPPLPPQLLGVDDRVNLTFLPPSFLIVHGVELLEAGHAEWHGPYTAHLAAYTRKAIEQRRAQRQLMRQAESLLEEID